jgi:prevent-host-death family protein
MAEVIGVAEAKRRFAELIDRVQSGERFVVARRGRPVMMLGPAEDEEDDSEPSEYTGFAALAGALADWPEFDEIMKEVVASRRYSRDRDVPYFDELE